jgi:phosphohistidine phosphatase SixA
MKRSKQTFQAIYQNINPSPKFIFDDNLHQITESELRDKIQWTPAMYNKILVVGHNPCLSQFIKAVCQKQKALDSCEYVVLAADVNSWQEIEYNMLTIVERVKPRVSWTS